MTRLKILLLLFLFAACRKADVSTPKETSSNPPLDTTVSYLPDQIRFGSLNWVVHEDQHLLTAELKVTKPYAVEKIILVHAEGGTNSFDIPRFDGSFTPTLYYKSDSGKVTIYAYYTAGTPPKRNDFRNESDYTTSLHYFALAQIGIGSVKIHFNSLSYDPPDGDSTLSDELTYRINWVPESEHLVSATLDIPEGYLVADITLVTAFGVDTVTVSQFDRSVVQDVYYKTQTRQIVVFKHSDTRIPMPDDFDNGFEYVIALAYWQRDFKTYHTIKIEFK